MTYIVRFTQEMAVEAADESAAEKRAEAIVDTMGTTELLTHIHYGHIKTINPNDELKKLRTLVDELRRRARIHASRGYEESANLLENFITGKER